MRQIILQAFVASLSQLVVGATLASSKYDYIIVGGGTAGSVLAARLSEDPSVSVALIEAGDSVLDNEEVKTIYGNCVPCASAIDWNYTTVAQSQLGGLTLPYHAGKCLGGSSTLNGQVYLRPHKAEFGTWQAVGNKDWSWDSLLPYMKESEKLQIPPVSQQAQGATYISSVHGFNGPLDVGYSPNLSTPDFVPLLNQTWQSFGLKWNVDANAGSPAGFFYHPSTFNLQLGGIREDAARAFYWPIANRSNLHTFKNTIASKVLLSTAKKSSSLIEATGVEISTGGKTQTISARREVILAAGSYRTPGLLEASGVGNPSILGDRNVKVDLPGVGYNYQDQYISSLSYSTTSNYNSTAYGTDTPTYAFVTIEDIFGDEASAVAAAARQNITAYAQTLAASSNGVTTVANAKKLLKLRMDLIFDQKAPVAELIFSPEYIAFWQTLPFSRGTIRTSAEDSSNPLINPNFYQIDFDLKVHAAIARFVRKLYATSPLNTVETEISPGLSVVPENGTDAQWKAFFETNSQVGYHGVGSAAMMSKDLGGVVDSKLVVYGTSNLRVIDASVFPFEVNGHPMSTLYGLAEKGADMIVAKWA